MNDFVQYFEKAAYVRIKWVSLFSLTAQHGFPLLWTDTVFKSKGKVTLFLWKVTKISLSGISVINRLLLEILHSTSLLLEITATNHPLYCFS